MENHKSLFAAVDKIQEAEGHFVAREVGRYVFVRDFGTFEEAEEAIALCQNIFVHQLDAARPVHELVDLVVKMCTSAHRNTYAVHQNKVNECRDGIGYVIANARTTFRAYLPQLMGWIR